ncbi:MAG: family 43 glycosylhydrolase [Firmicutes bacterium]|nr:family 43 glycosylhydrolase [Bacillota bacterium]
MKRKIGIILFGMLAVLLISSLVMAANPIITNIFTADPAALVYNGKVYLYTGHDEAPAGGTSYVMKNWACFSSSDMINWTSHGYPLAVTNFSWAKADAWASQVVYRNGKFYWYVCVEHKTIPGKAIGVAVSTSPTGPFTDARGSALITNNMTTQTDISWDDIDPTVFIDDDGQAYMYWGNTVCKYVKLNSDMISYSGSINVVNLPGFTEAPWLHKRNGIYYLSYAYGWPEKIAYATSSSPTGPWTYRGIVNDLVPNCGTNHQAIIEFNGNWYFIYHNGVIGGDYRRSVCIDYLYYNSDGTMKQVVQTTAGVGGPTPTSGPAPTSPPSGSYVKLRNRATNLCIDGMGRTSNGANAGQYSSNTSYNQQWVLESAGSYYKIKNRTTGLYLDGMGRTSNGSICGQWPSSTSYNQQWSRETVGSYYKFKNRATGLYLDGMGSTSNGADLCQWGSSQSYNQQWSIVAP